MGGLRRLMPVTFVTMTIGLAALAGIPPFSGFFSKEAVLVGVEEAIHDHTAAATWVPWFVLVVALLTVGVTAAYATQAVAAGVLRRAVGLGPPARGRLGHARSARRAGRRRPPGSA